MIQRKEMAAHCLAQVLAERDSGGLGQGKGFKEKLRLLCKETRV